MTHTDVRTLCRVLDECPSAEIPALVGVLADALEEAGDPLAAGMRQVVAMGSVPSVHAGYRHCWVEGNADDSVIARDDTIFVPIWDRLQDGISGYDTRPSLDGGYLGVRVKSYYSVSAALLALAEALNHEAAPSGQEE
jgi:hypothetical protein